ncbi:MAG: His/Gly/Thr/Pro-type tRNA ligase C-terminal domain-containing protein [Candidatus Kaiserbacteria bacterium]|nr:His/Gly/Thr/Pro-type tRNA ligase C-terminal domain-containing protein [Candidatus Kaiserbacteria bacterium]
MKQSFLVTKTRKEGLGEDTAINAELLVRAGYVHKTMAGVYTFLPLGLRMLNNIVGIIREEMDAIGGQEMHLSALQNPSVWQESGRWGGDAESVWFRSSLQSGGDVGLAWTHEEPVTEMLRHHVSSYRDLPCSVYQFQTKFRNEERAKSGLLRTREFLMKDLYSLSRNEEEHKAFYERCAGAYLRIFDRIGLGDSTYRTFASGGAFSQFSDEFQTVLASGEDTIYLHREKRIAVNEEVYTDEVLEKVGLDRSDLEQVQSCEVGNIFTLGTRFSEALNLLYTDESGDTSPVFMGSYGIGPSRLMGVIAEQYSDGEQSMVLPDAVAPFRLHLIALGASSQVQEAASTLYDRLQDREVSVLFDDRDLSAGEKFADSDLVGIPHRIVISDRTQESGQVEYLDRKTGKTSMHKTDPDGMVKLLYA